MIVLARRLPPGIAKDLAAFIPDCVTTARTLRKDPRVPRRARPAVALVMQSLIRLAERFERRESRDLNALVFALVAVKP